MKYICEYCNKIFDDAECCRKHYEICSNKEKITIKKIAFDGKEIQIKSFLGILNKDYIGAKEINNGDILIDQENILFIYTNNLTKEHEKECFEKIIDIANEKIQNRIKTLEEKMIKNNTILNKYINKS